MATNVQAVAPRVLEPAALTTDEPLILNSIASEISRALTYVTVARIAYEIGQPERGGSAYETAAEAEAEATKLTGRLNHPARAMALKQLEDYRLIREDSQHKDFRFPPSLLQPSLN